MTRLTRILVGIILTIVVLLGWATYKTMQAHDQFMLQTCNYCQKGKW